MLNLLNLPYLAPISHTNHILTSPAFIIKIKLQLKFQEEQLKPSRNQIKISRRAGETSTVKVLQLM